MRNVTKLGIISCAVIGLCALREVAHAESPRYEAHASFSINWNQVAGDEGNSDLDAPRREFNASLRKFKVGKQFVSILCEKCGIPDTQSGAVAKNLRRHIKIIPVAITNGCQLYRIQFEGNNEEVALKAVDLLNQRFVAGFNQNLKIKQAGEALHSFGDNADSRHKEDRLRQELATLSQQPNNAGNAARINEINQELSGADREKTLSGLNLLFHGVGVFLNPAKIEQPGVVALIQPAR